ncbi:MAG TPA: hypothetical protein VK982_02245 [Bacteroidales bacterium]|nr:hypothetical protein [Bacteroidales bacterium]
MNKQIRDKFPNWVNNNTEYSLCLSDDIDSFGGSIVLNKIKGYKITHFYTFNAIGTYKQVKKGNLIGVDIDLTEGKTWGNHVTMLSKYDTYNKECANINVINKISRENYYSKFCGSTLLQILSYYNVDISNLTEEQLEILICIDTGFKQYYFNKKIFIHYYKDVLEYPQFVDIVSKHNKQYFYNIIKKYKLHEKIHVKNGYLKTKIDLAGLSRVFSIPISLPTQKFNLITEFKTDAKSIKKSNYNVVKDKDIFSLAVTNRNFYVYSKIKKGGN